MLLTPSPTAGGRARAVGGGGGGGEDQIGPGATALQRMPRFGISDCAQPFVKLMVAAFVDE